MEYKQNKNTDILENNLSLGLDIILLKPKADNNAIGKRKM